MPLRDVEQIVYFNAYVVLSPGNAENLSYKQLLTEDQWLEIESNFTAKIPNSQVLEVGIGAEALQRLLQDVELDTEGESCEKTLLPLKVKSEPS